MNHILQKLRESRIREAESHEYKFNVPWREVVQDEYDTIATIYNPTQMDYASDIMEKAEEDFNDADLASYARDDGLGFVKSMTMSFDEESRCIITVETTKVLEGEDMHRLIEYLTGQMSDGWGEGFEQREIAEFQEDSEEWIEDPDDEDAGGYYDTVEHHYYVSGQFWWSDTSHPHEITLVTESQNESADALSADDMRRELVKYGDFTEEEANNLKGLELTSAWSKLPRDIREEKDATSDYRREVEKVLNHQLGSYETGVSVLGVKVKSQTPGTVTLDVEYDVNIQIPVVDPEDGRTYYEQETEYRRRTMTIEFDELGESASVVEDIKQEAIYDIMHNMLPRNTKARAISFDNEYEVTHKSGNTKVVVKFELANDAAEYVFTIDGKKYTADSDVDVSSQIQKSLNAKHFKGFDIDVDESISYQGYTIKYVNDPQGGKHVEVYDKDKKFKASYEDEEEAKSAISKGEIEDRKDESLDRSVGATFKNAGYTWEVLDTRGEYTLVYAKEKQWHPYVVAWKLSDDGSWAQGHYFKEEEDARKYLAHKSK